VTKFPDGGMCTDEENFGMMTGILQLAIDIYSWPNTQDNKGLSLYISMTVMLKYNMHLKKTKHLLPTRQASHISYKRLSIPV
jgi:hypothetical protein